MLKFGTLVEWMNIWECLLFYFWKSSFSSIWDPFSYIFVHVLELWGSLAKLKVV